MLLLLIDVVFPIKILQKKDTKMFTKIYQKLFTVFIIFKQYMQHFTKLHLKKCDHGPPKKMWSLFSLQGNP